LVINPHDVHASRNKGTDLDILGNYTGAILYYDKALAVDPHNVNALTNKGNALNNLGNHTGAILNFDKALAVDPHNVNALTNKGNALNNLGNHTVAIYIPTKVGGGHKQLLDLMDPHGPASQHIPRICKRVCTLHHSLRTNAPESEGLPRLEMECSQWQEQ
jgi:tetratricopeptide (TPR) repeat protein